MNDFHCQIHRGDMGIGLLSRLRVASGVFWIVLQLDITVLLHTIIT